MKIRMAYLEWYKKWSKDNKNGYYHNYKNASHTSDLEITKHMKALACYWEQIVDEPEKRPHVGASLYSRWHFAGTNYQRMIEPLFIAEYYKEDSRRDYINQGRAKHFKQLEQRQFKETEKLGSGPNF